VVANAIGFSGHGKTVYFAALFYALKKFRLSQHWQGFFTMALNEDSLDTVYENVAMLEDGKLPDTTPKVFPRPAILRVVSMPMQPNCTLLFYDTSGECFERPTELVQHAGFVRRARTAMFLISLSDLVDPEIDMHKLLNAYVVGMRELNANTKHQHLVVVYTKADEIFELLKGREELNDYIRRNSIDGLVHLQNYMREMYRISAHLREFTQHKLRANEFLNAADANFKSVSFCMVSALGAKPQGQQTLVQIVPRCIFEPMLWLMESSLPKWKKIWHRWRG